MINLFHHKFYIFDFSVQHSVEELEIDGFTDVND